MNKRKGFRLFTILALCMVLVSSFSMTAFAYADDTDQNLPITDATQPEDMPDEKPEDTPTTVLPEGEPIDDEGNAYTRDLLYDKATNKQFITVQTKSGNTFYIVIDYDAPINDEEEQYQTYFLNMVDEADYGYSWAGMLPMREEAAAEVMMSCTIYRLYGDDTEGMVMTAAEIKPHADKGGIFGVEKGDWIAALERQNPLKAAELSTEDDYGMIDGIINNGPKAKEDKSSEKDGKSSIMDRLKAAKSEPHQEKPTPHKERKNDRDL